MIGKPLELSTRMTLMMSTKHAQFVVKDDRKQRCKTIRIKDVRFLQRKNRNSQ